MTLPVVRLMLALVCVCVGCSSQQPTLDAARVDVPLDAPNRREGLVFQDRIADRAAPTDASDRGTARDLDASRSDKPSPDKMTPDLTSVSPCPTDWSKWSCGPTPVGGCAATCSGYVLNCVPTVPIPGIPMACTCTKGGQTKTCSGSGLLCGACGNAFSSCCKL